MRSIIIVAMAACLCSVSRADWPQFRGPDGQGVARDANIPLTWSETENISWKADVPGKGWSSPVVLGEQIWLTTAIEQKPTPEQIERQFKQSGLDEEQFKRRQVAGNVSLRAICLSRSKGEVIHDIEVASTDTPEAIHIGNTYASPTPVIENDRVYCHFGINGTFCIDTTSGKQLWKKTVPLFYSVGAGSSPVIYKNLLILVCDGVDTQFIIALDKNTGETVWKTPRPPFRTDDGQHQKAYSTPLVIRYDGRDQLVIPGAQWFVSYEPESGKEIWRVDHGEGFSNVPRPVFGHGMVYICTGFGQSELWAIRVDGQGDVTNTHVAWKETSQISKNPSPILVDDLLFMISDAGIASCLDALTGEAHWKKRVAGNYSASPIYASGRVYFFSHEGDITVVDASREYAELAKSHIDGQLMASPAVLKSTLLLRSDSKLYCIQ